MSSFNVTTDREGGRSFPSRGRGKNYKKGGSRGGRGGDRDRDRDGGRSNDYGGDTGGPMKKGSGSFKRNKNRRQGGYYNPGRSGGSRTLGDDDEDMGEGSGSQRRFTPYGGSRGSRGRGNARKSSLDRMNRNVLQRLGVPMSDGRGSDSYSRSRDSNYWKITIPHGKKTDKSIILQSLKDELPSVPFIPQQYHHEGTSAVFYLDSSDAAKSLKSASRKISLPTGFKMIILASPCAAPKTSINEEIVEKMKVAMSRRYDPASKVLNLSDFFNDADFKDGKLHIALSKPNVARAVTDIIGENIPELVSLDLSNNRLYTLESFDILSTKSPELAKLNLKGNRVKSVDELTNLSKLQKLDELWLDGNPVCDQFKDETTYISAVRKKCPKIAQLDGHVLPPPITFGLDQPTSLPSTQGSYFTNEPQVKDLICRFLEQYYALYDSDNRQQLLDAYHDTALFSMSVTYNSLVVKKQIGFEYLHDSRNLMKVKDSVKQQKSLKSGKLNVVAYLTTLPKTQHDPASFVVDVTLATPTLMMYVVRGVFKESSDRGTSPMRSFSRSFVTVPQGSGIVIINEEFSITNASPHMMKNSFKGQAPGPTPSSSPVTAGPSVNSEQRQEMVKQFCLQSGMNQEWTIKCLEQNAWDYEKSASVYAEYNAAGKIPPEAFLK